MEITTKFNLGEDVFWVQKDVVTKPCPVCDSEHSVTLHGNKYPCPECRGTGRISYAVDWIVGDHGAIWKISASVSRTKFWDNITYLMKGLDISMDEQHIFHTLEEAQEWCLESNLHSVNTKEWAELHGEDPLDRSMVKDFNFNDSDEEEEKE